MLFNRVPVSKSPAAQTRDAASVPADTRKPAPHRRVFSRVLSSLGIASFAYLLGAAVMFFELPSSGFLTNAFVGARAWNERREFSSGAATQRSSPVLTRQADKPATTFDGFTLYTASTAQAPKAQAYLVDMTGQQVHQWAMPFSKVWPNPPHIHGRIDDFFVTFFATHLYANGDLLVVYHGLDALATGYGLIKLDKDSNVLWKYPALVHHDVDVGEDGSIYAIQQEVLDEAPHGLELIPTPCVVDYLVMLSPGGRLLRKPIGILEAFRDSPYAAFLSALDKPTEQTATPNLPAARFTDSVRRWDVLHTNFVHVLSRELAASFPQFKPGQVLLSIRNLDTLAVLDTEKNCIVWAARGPWQGQHDAQFLANGHLLVFDNHGSAKSSRVLEYDPRTLAVPWSYSGENWGPFRTPERGLSQRLANGNTLVVSSWGGDLLEVTPDKEVVWSFAIKGYVPTARRYAPEQLSFLTGHQRARP